jgi:hypothetical protein
VSSVLFGTMIEARWLEIMVSSDHPLADERVAEAIARVLSRYWVDTASGVELIMTHRGADIAYLASRVYPVPILGGYHHQDVRV